MATSLSISNARRRATRVRAVLRAGGTAAPRLSVHRTLRHMYAQVIDDLSGRTLASSSDLQLKLDGRKSDVAAKVGAAVAEAALLAGVTAVRFDRGSFPYHGRVAKLAEAARGAGLKF